MSIHAHIHDPTWDSGRFPVDVAVDMIRPIMNHIPFPYWIVEHHHRIPVNSFLMIRQNIREIVFGVLPDLLVVISKDENLVSIESRDASVQNIDFVPKITENENDVVVANNSIPVLDHFLVNSINRTQLGSVWIQINQSLVSEMWIRCEEKCHQV